MAAGSGFWVLVYRFAWVTLAVLLLGVAAAVFYPPWNQMRGLQQKHQGIQDEIRNREEQIRHLKAKQERLLSDPVAVEQEARSRGMARPGETIVRVIESDATGAPPVRAP
jgi:cell division protein FtsB